MDSPSYQPGLSCNWRIDPHTHWELRAREKLQANAEAIVDAWLRNHAPPQSAFRLPPSVTFHIETTARNAPGMAVSSVPSGTALPESAGASSAHFVEPPAQDQAASDDAVTPGAAGPDAADPVSHASRDFLYFPAAEAFPHSGFPPSPAHVAALLTACAETPLPDSDDETAGDETTALTRKRARESYGSDAGAPRKQPLRAVSSPNSSSCEESVLDSGADSGETDIAPCALGAPAGPPPAPDSPNFSQENTVGELEGLRLSSAAEGSPAIQVPSSVAGTASQRDHEKSDLDLEAPHYPEGPFHETENAPPHPPASAGPTTMAEDGDTGTVDCGAPVSAGTGGSRPPATAFQGTPLPLGLPLQRGSRNAGRTPRLRVDRGPACSPVHHHPPGLTQGALHRHP
ncbi:hypothetical protein HPB50_026733 [Hyalomma asiaticum]|uniref:Uncharacterized protein n=1 Tax=Hyalomma asiaticum TaxID=266040 RepID=A0ACB7SQS4_HYAAI|nr:hypothetical protein HPB50_026733 [Hyalomma asiaticum]